MANIYKIFINSQALLKVYKQFQFIGTIVTFLYCRHEVTVQFKEGI